MAQQAEPFGQAAVPALVQDAVRAQQRNMQHEGWAVRYRVHRTDAKEDSVRDLVQTTEGNVARTIERGGHPLSPERQAAEAQRLRELASTGPRHHGPDPTDRYGKELVAAMPSAMDYLLVPDQPQLPQFATAQVVLDFHPRDGFQPATTAQALLKGLGGRLWIDRRTHHLLRMELEVQQDLNVALGLLARVYKGGRLVYEQVPLDADHDVYRYLEIDVRLRELMLRNVPFHLLLQTSDVRVLPAVPSLQQGIDMLLAQ